MRSSIQSQLETLGVMGQTYKAGREMLVTCPFHDDHDPSMSINLTDGRWYCFAESKGGDWMELIAALKRSGQFVEGVPEPYEAKKEPMLKSWADRGFTSEMLVKWGIKWDPEIHAMRIPVLTEDGEHQANIWRAPEGVEPPYRYDPGFPKSEVLFGLWRLSRPLPSVVLVEGPLDAIWVQSCDIPCVAVLGSDLSDEQVSLLSARSVRKVTLCFDNDAAGAHVTYEAKITLRRAGMWVYRVALPGKYNDIQNAPRKEVGGLIANAKIIISRGGTVHPRFKRWTGGEETESSVWRRQ